MKSPHKFIKAAAPLLLALALFLPSSADEGETAEAPEAQMQIETPAPTLEVEPEATEPLVTTPTFTLDRDEEKETADGLLFYTDPESGYVIITGYSGYLAELVIPSAINGGSVTAVAEGAFAQNTTLEKLALPDSILTLGEAFCEGCTNLQAIDLPDMVTELPASAFRGCEKLDTIILPDSITSIGDFAFEGCARLGWLKMPSALTSIGYDAFMGCEGLIFDASDNSYVIEYAEINGIALGFTDTFLYHVILMLVITAAIGISGLLIRRVYRSGKQ